MDKLKPCPFCGGDATHGAEVIFGRSGSNNLMGATVVRCSAMCWGKCRANMSFEYVADKTVKNPTEAGMRMIAKQWNTRTNSNRTKKTKNSRF